MKLYKMCIISLMLMGTYLQADATKEPVCKNTVECDKLIHTIEVQINPLEKKGIENLTDKEFEKLDVLQGKLLAAQRAKTAEEKAKQAAYAEVSKKLDIIDGSLK